MASPDLQISKLAAAMQRARLVLRRPRSERVDMVRELVGRHYSEEGATRDVPVNMIAMYTTIIGRKLMSNAPRAMLSTFDPSSKAMVAAMESWINKEIYRTQLAETFRRSINDSLFWGGVIKVALATPADSASQAWNLDAAEPFAECIDLDDFVFDIHARTFKKVTFIGHRFRAPLRVIKESKMYSKNRTELTADWDQLYNMEGDERISVIGRTSIGGDTEEYEDHVDLWEVYLPQHGVIVTLHHDQVSAFGKTGDGRENKALRIQKWIGPDTGPYHILSLGEVPGNIQPTAPVQNLLDLHKSLNRIMRKLMRQADRQKETGLVSGGAAEDGKRILETNDGEFSLVDKPENAKVVNFGGPNQANFQLFMAFKELFSWLSGNLDIAGGLSPQSKTAHQDEMLNQNSSATIGEMQSRVVEHVASVLRALCWYWHHHPTKTMKVHHVPAGAPVKGIQRVVTPERRQRVDFEDLDLRVDPYSLQHQTPQTRMTAITQLLTQIYLPLAQMFQSQGITISLSEFLQLSGKYMDQPDLAELFTVQEPPQQEGPSGGGGSGTPGMPQETTRNYVRRSLGGDSQQAKAAGLDNMLAKGSGTNGQVNGAIQ